MHIILALHSSTHPKRCSHELVTRRAIVPPQRLAPLHSCVQVPRPPRLAAPGVCRGVIALAFVLGLRAVSRTMREDHNNQRVYCRCSNCGAENGPGGKHVSRSTMKSHIRGESFEPDEGVNFVVVVSVW